MKSRYVFPGLALAASLLTTMTCFSSHAQAPAPAQRPGDESARANAFFDRVFDEAVARSPQFMAQLGIKKDTDKWDDLSEARALEDFSIKVQALAELKRTINFEALDEQTRVSYRMFVNDAERAIEGWKWRHHSYAVTQLNGPYSDAPAFLINYHPVENVADARAYVARLRGMTTLFDQLIDGMKIREAKQVLPPRFVFPLIVDSVHEVINGQPFDSSSKKCALLEDFEGKNKKLSE